MWFSQFVVRIWTLDSLEDCGTDCGDVCAVPTKGGIVTFTVYPLSRRTEVQYQDFCDYALCMDLLC